MSSVLPNSSPTLSYIGAVDVTSADFGSTMYSIFFPASIVGLGNVLMFEYKKISADVEVPTPNDVTLGFIPIENASNSGLLNQWNVSVPANDYTYLPDTPIKIAIRVYIGITDSSEVAVTEWSNALDVHNPPNKPTIFDTYYDTPSTNLPNGTVRNLDDLYIFLTVNNDEAYYTDNRFVVAYYYEDISNNTVWQVSDPLTVTQATIGSTVTKMIHVPEFGSVSENSEYQKVYVAVYAVYEFSDSLGKNYYSVSHISETVTAEKADLYNSPTINNILYKVHNEPSEQIMTVQWSAPDVEGIPTYAVNNYVLEKSTDNFNWSLADVSSNNIPSNVTSYDVDVSSYDCETTVYFRVYAISSAGTISPTSTVSSLNIFKYALAPTDLMITDTSYNNNDGTVTIEIRFNMNDNTGCGEPIEFGIRTSGTQFGVVNQTVDIIPDNGSSPYYSALITSNTISQTGIVEVYLITRDTNNSNVSRDGASASIPYVAVNLDLDAVNYLVYSDTDRPQTMELTWTSLSGQLPGWSVTKYNLLYKTQNDSNFTQLAEDLSTSYYVFNAADPSINVDECGNTITFKIVGTLNSDINNSQNATVESGEQSINIFKYPDAPTDLYISNASYNSGTVVFDLNFDAPDYIGCGSANSSIPNTGFVIHLTSASENITITQDYTGSGSYVQQINNNDILQTGNVEVYLVTQDTNDTSVRREGPSVTIPYVATNLVLDPVDYLVYSDTDRPQSMQLTWNNPLNGLSGWYVEEYFVSYSVNGGGFIEVTGTNITSESYVFDAADPSIDVADCGNNIAFKVRAVLKYSDDNTQVITIVSNEESINVFKYADAPTNLYITDVSYSSGVVELNVHFDAPNDIGCGSANVPGSGFTVLLTDSNNNTYYETISYDGPGSYSLVINTGGNSLTQTGNVEVYLITQDTNDSSAFRSGAIATIPYVATDLDLGTVNYLVYSDTDRPQTMELTWNNPLDGLSGWYVEEYIVLYSVNGGNFVEVTGTNITSESYEFDASDPSIDVAYCGNNIAFKIRAVLKYSDDNTQVITITSGEQSVNIYKYATEPQNLQVLWASVKVIEADGQPTVRVMDMRLQFQNPSDVGCGDSPITFEVVIKDQNGDVKHTESDIAYVNTPGTYTVNLNDVDYTQSGYAYVYLKTNDTNGLGVLSGAEQSAFFQSSELPIFRNLFIGSSGSVTNMLTFNVITQTPLGQKGEFRYRSGLSSLFFNWLTDGTQNGITVSSSILPNQEIQYEFNLNPLLVVGSTTWPVDSNISVSNNIGTKSAIVN